MIEYEESPYVDVHVPVCPHQACTHSTLREIIINISIVLMIIATLKIVDNISIEIKRVNRDHSDEERHLHWCISELEKKVDKKSEPAPK